MSPVAAINDHQEPPQAESLPFHGQVSAGAHAYLSGPIMSVAPVRGTPSSGWTHGEGSSVTSGETMTSHHPFGYSGPQWRTASGCNNGTCVEVAELPHGGVGIRDNKDGNSPVLEFTLDEFRTFVRGVKAGEFDI
ncbi:DUF397 domain-containing protein [Sphaerisporangium sp. NBC_01403]|uniref:DUF397 domain-containing protein n=1 Tax=Sphaerisporangium sp. NBC_01403 TaxID=2903599 RepID=UPI00386B6155